MDEKVLVEQLRCGETISIEIPERVFLAFKTLSWVNFPFTGIHDHDGSWHVSDMCRMAIYENGVLRELPLARDCIHWGS